MKKSMLLAVLLPLTAQANEIIRPDINEPLRDAVVTRAPDGTWYLTGTRAMAREWDTKPDTTHDPYFVTESKESRKEDGSLDFMDNDGVKVWSSQDLVTWKDEGLVWDLLTQQSFGYYDWRARVFAFPDRKVKDRRVRGATTPRIQFVGGVPHLIHSMGGHDVGIMRSRNAGVQGPYEAHHKQGKDNRWDMKYNQSSVGPGYGSIFEDRDGSRYLIWGPGYVVEMTADLTTEKGGETPRDASQPMPKGHQPRPPMIGPPGKPFDLLSKVKGYPNADWCAQQFSPRAGAVFLHEGRYFFTWSAMTDIGGVKREDSFVAVADTLRGPFSEPSRLVAGSGPVWLFDAGERGLLLSCSMDDAPALIPLKADGAGLVAQGVETPEAVKPTLPGKPDMFDYAKSQPSGQWHQPHPETGRSKLVPLFDLPLRDISIAKGGDPAADGTGGAWYMTGTTASRRKTEDGGRKTESTKLPTKLATKTSMHPTPDTRNIVPDFQNNDGIYLWRSEDLNTWLPMGKVWDIEQDGGAWQKQYRIPANNPTATEFARGVTAPEIAFHHETYWLAYSMNGRGTGLLKSRTGKPEGPYEDLGRITAMGGAPSLFIDADGAALWLWGDMRAARMRPDLGGIEGETVSLYLQCAASNLGPFHDPTDRWDHTAPHLFTAVEPKSKKRKYYLTCEAITQRNGRANRESFVAEAEHPFGPYTEPFLMIPHGGQTSVFEGPDSKWYASFFGADTTAVFRDRPGIVPLEFGVRDLPRKINYSFYTQRGPWDSVVPPMPNGMADYRMTFLPDGNFYIGSSLHVSGLHPYHGTVPVWQSRDLRNWKVLTLYTHDQADQEPVLPAKKEQQEGWLSKGSKLISWATGLYYVKGDYYLRTILTGMQNKEEPCRITLKSATGKAEGPYELFSNLSTECMFENDDGSVYATLSASSGSLLKLSPDLRSIDDTWASPLGRNKQFNPKRPDGTQFANDCGSAVWKTDGKYVMFTLDGYGSYPTRYFWADRIVGPWRELGVIPYAGHGQIAQGPDGTWWTAHQFLHEHYNYCAPTPGGHTVFLPLEVDMQSDPPRIQYRYDHEAGVDEMSVYGRMKDER